MSNENNTDQAFATQQIPVLKCNTCGKHVTQPYRNVVDGEIVNGCIDACHTNHLSPNGADYNWHHRPEAEAHRDDIRQHQEDMSLNGLHGLTWQ